MSTHPNAPIQPTTRLLTRATGRVRRPSHWLAVLALAVLMTGLLTACGDSDDSQAAAADSATREHPTHTASATDPTAAAPSDEPVPTDVTRLEIDAADYSFTSLDEVPAGWVEIVFTNSGTEPHHAQLARLNDGVTLAQFEQTLAEDELAGLELVTLTGGPAAVDPGGTGNVLLNLPEGEYALICLIPSPDGHTHLEKGMIKSLTVTSPTDDDGSQDLPTIGMRDFSFEFPETLPAGQSLYEVVNDGQQAHEIAIIKPNRGVTADEALAVLSGESAPSGPPPFSWEGGMQALSPGETGLLRLDLPPGDYVAVCMVPDTATGQRHIMLGMVQEFSVE